MYEQRSLPAALLRIPADQRQEADSTVLLRRGSQALWTDGDLHRSRELFDAAYRAAENEGNGSAMALAAIGLGGLWVQEHRQSAAEVMIQSRQRHALQMIPPESHLALRLCVRLAAESDYRAGTHETVLSMLSEAQKSDDPTTRAEALNLAHHCLLGPEHAAARHQIARDLIAEGARSGRRSDFLMGMLWQTVDFFMDGHPQADRRLNELRAALNKQDHLAVGCVVDGIDVMLHIRAGRFDEAEAAAGVCLRRGTAAGDLDAVGWHGAHIVTIRWFQGRMAELLPSLEVAVASPSLGATDHSFLAALAVSAAAAGERQKAAGALARLAREDLRRLPSSGSWLISIHGVIEAAYLLGDVDLAVIAYRLLLPHRRLPVIAGLGITCFGSAEHALGVASLCIGDVGSAVAHFRAALRDNLALGHWPAAALSRARLAQAMSLTGQPSDAEALQELSIARQEADSLGMRLPDTEVVTPAIQRERIHSQVVCRRHGRKWVLELAHRSATVEHSVGMAYLAILLANPGHEIAAAELAGGPNTDRNATTRRASRMHQPILDEAALQAYRRRLVKLQDDLARHDAIGDAAAAEAAEHERDWLITELSATIGLGRRVRTFDTAEERARVAVGKAIRRALARIIEADPIIGHRLQATVHTGRLCRYIPF